LAFHQKVRAGYLDLAQQEPARFRVIDAGRDAAAVGRAVEGVLASLLERMEGRT
jgi:dTMP kinase